MLQVNSWLLYSWTLASRMMWCVSQGAPLRAQPSGPHAQLYVLLSHMVCAIHSPGRDLRVAQARLGSKVYVCSTERGAVLELSLPHLKQARYRGPAALPLGICRRFNCLHRLHESTLPRTGAGAGVVHPSGAHQLGGASGRRLPPRRPAQFGQGAPLFLLCRHHPQNT